MSANNNMESEIKEIESISFGMIHQKTFVKCLHLKLKLQRYRPQIF